MMKIFTKYLAPIGLSLFLVLAAQAQVYKDSSQPLENRVQHLISQLTLEEKVSLLGYQSKEVQRLGIPAYNWWNEGLHGVARAGKATVFPQAIAMAATFNDGLVQQIADVISTEARAKYNLAIARGNRSQYMGLTFWSPNINIFRDPRWGRGQETYGEDPFLTAKMGVAFVKGLQGNHPTYLKTAACAKHFAAHSGPEVVRHSFNAQVSEKDLRETYLYAFRKLVDAGVESVMCAYNRLNDVPCCSNNLLLNKILREEWQFKGHVVADCWALDDIYKGHQVLKNPVEVAAAALKAGVNLDCSELVQKDLLEAVKQKLITESEINKALAGLLRTQFKLGFYDDAKSNPYSYLNEQHIQSAQHIALSRKAAQQSMVLLKNDKQLLPLGAQNYQSIVVIGPNAGSVGPLLGNYHGVSENLVTFIEGITAAAGPAVAVQYEQGSDYTDTLRFGGVWAAGQSDLTIAIVGLTPVLEGEEHDAFLSEKGGDKSGLDIPKAHVALLKELKTKNPNKPLVAVVTAGSAVDIAAIQAYADAIILAWYPGEQGGNALADILFGKVSPSGKLPVTFYQSLADLPPYESYDVKGRTYRYFNGKVQYPFGFGLSYTSFTYNWVIPPTQNIKMTAKGISFSVKVKNTGKVDADEVVQAYIKYPQHPDFPLKELKAFKRISLKAGEEQTLSLEIPVEELKKWSIKQKKMLLNPGQYELVLGSHAADEKLKTTIKF
nr:glycoside hydrolase family 3 N-terminal domain-containing protein [Pedobacter glucosidilyticus]